MISHQVCTPQIEPFIPRQQQHVTFFSDRYVIDFSARGAQRYEN
jgi:hypothetical protein